MRLETIATSGLYVPEFNGNRELPAEEQIVVEHRIPSVKINETLSNMRFNFTQDGEVSGTTELTRKKLCTMFIKSVKNLEIPNRLGKGGETTYFAIKNADDLFSDRAPIELEGLCDELFTYFNRIRKQEIDEKN